MSGLLRAAAAVTGVALEARRRCYARGWLRAERVGSRVVSVGNLTVGGTGKTTLTLHLARRAISAGLRLRVVGRRYRPGPGGRGDEELLFASALGEERVMAGSSKRDLARRAAADGVELVLVDDGFSHWGLERDVNLVLLDAGDPWGGGQLLPAGRLREPRRSLERADAVVVSRIGAGGIAPELAAEIAWRAPGALVASGRHRVRAVRAFDGSPCELPATVRVVTATGNPAAVEVSAREAGCAVIASSYYRDHHWFSVAEARAEQRRAETDHAVILLTAKDAVRWPPEVPGARVLEVEWEWASGGEAIERLVLSGERA